MHSVALCWWPSRSDFSPHRFDEARSPRRPLHDRDSVTGFQHRRRISSILIRNTVVPIAIRTTLGSCLAIGRQITENPELL